jgi:hypothetical protein
MTEVRKRLQINVFAKVSVVPILIEIYIHALKQRLRIEVG